MEARPGPPLFPLFAARIGLQKPPVMRKGGPIALNLVVREGGMSAPTENCVVQEGPTLPLFPSHLTPDGGLPAVAMMAIEQMVAMGQMLALVDQAIVVIDKRLDALQPPAPGKVRIVFRKDRQTVRPVFVKFLQRRNGGWWTKAISVGWASRSVKDTKNFEKNAELVRIFCREANELMKIRVTLTRLLTNSASAGMGAIPQLDQKLAATRSALGLVEDGPAAP